MPDDAPEVQAVAMQSVTAKFYGRKGVTLQRVQLPLNPCWAYTIHRVQGLSLDAAVIDVSSNLVASVSTCFHMCRHFVPRWSPVVCAVIGSSVRVEHPSADETELRGGGGIHDKKR